MSFSEFSIYVPGPASISASLVGAVCSLGFVLSIVPDTVLASNLLAGVSLPVHG
jgi:hypothetical protein